MDSQTNLAAVKNEELGENSAPIRPRAMKIKEMEPVRQAAHETSDMHEDESMEDSENLFGKTWASYRN